MVSKLAAHLRSIGAADSPELRDIENIDFHLTKAVEIFESMNDQAKKRAVH